MYKESFVVVGGIEIRVLEAGSGAEALVFVHGNSCDAGYWTEQLGHEPLAARYRLIAFDLPGHGKSGRPAEYSMRDMAMLIPALVEQLGLDRYAMVGLSFGTYLIGEAASVLKGCYGYFLASPNIVNDAHPPASFLLPIEEGYAVVSPVVPGEVLAAFASRMVAETPDAAVLVKRYQQSYLETDGRFREAIGKAIMSADWTDGLANLSKDGRQAAIVFGRQEKLIRMDYLDDYSFRWRGKTHFIEDAAHLANLEQPAAFNALLLQWADDIFK